MDAPRARVGLRRGWRDVRGLWRENWREHGRQAKGRDVGQLERWERVWLLGAIEGLLLLLRR